MGLFGVDLFFFSFWFLFENFFSIVTSHLNLHSFFGSLFRYLKGVFVLPMVVSIINMRCDKSFLRLYSHFSFPFMISFLFLEIYLIWVLVSFSFFLYYPCNLLICLNEIGLLKKKKRKKKKED
jgi:hypothetical protein